MIVRILSTALLTSAILFGGHFAIVAAEEATITDQATEKQATIEQIRAVREAREEERAIKRQEVLSRLQRFAVKVIDRYKTELTRLRTKIQNSTLSSDLRTNILAQIDTRLSRLDSLRTTISAATTMEAIKQALKEARDEAVAIKVVKNRYNAQLLVHRFDNLFAKLDAAIGKLEERITTLKAQGKDVTELEATIAQAKSKIATAKEKIAAAKAKFDTLSPTSIKSVNDASSSAHTGVVEAIQLTKDAHQFLQSLISKIKVTQGGAP